MNGFAHLKKIREYCDYVEEHLNNVSKAWDLMVDKCSDMRFIYDDFYFHTIIEMISTHDLSKFSPEEFIQYQQNFFPVGENKSSGFESAWEHHKECNGHHWQNWINQPSWECHAVCMVCDWIAMGFKFEDSAQSYYEKNKDNIDIPEPAVKFIYEIFERVK